MDIISENGTGGFYVNVGQDNYTISIVINFDYGSIHRQGESEYRIYKILGKSR